jgi:DNA-binding CsgD family transcriptional regulator
LTGRAAECEALLRVLTSVRGGFSATLVLRGEAGIGKTSLLDFAVESAWDFQTLRVTGIESEMELGYAALHQLVRPLSAAIDDLPGPQQRALASAFGLADGAAPDRFLVGLAILTLLSEAANERRLLCVVDDAQWLDQASAEVLAFVARRLHADRIAFLFAVREPSEHHVDLEGLSSLRVPGLSSVAARQVITGLVAGPLDWSVGGQIADRAAGNPLALVEMTRELTADQLAGAVLLPDPLPLGEDVQQRYWRRVAALPQPQQEFLLLAAAEPSGDLDLFERAVTHLGLDSNAARSAEIGGFVDFAGRVTFRHPLIRSAVYTGSPFQARRRIHTAIAAVSDQERDADRIAWHLAAAALAPDEEIAVLLERSADRAKSRGGFSAGAAFLRRAVELTPDAGRRAERLLAAAGAEFASGRADKALELLDQASPDLGAARQQAEGLQLRGAIQSALGEGNRASSTLLHAAQALAPLDPGASKDTLVDGLIAAFYSGRQARLEALEVLKEARTAGPEVGSANSADIPDLILDGYIALLTRDYDKAGSLLRRLVSVLVADDLPEEEGLHWYGYGMWCACELLDFDAWQHMAERWVAICREKGALMSLPLALDYLGTVQAFTGQLSAGETSNAEGRDILTATGNPDRLGSSRAVELIAPMYRGRAVEVRQAATAMLRDSDERGQGAGFYYSHYVLAMLEISMNNYDIALGHAQVVLKDNGPYFGGMILPEAVEAAVYCDDLVTAELALERLAVRAEMGRTETARGFLARCRALLSSGDDSEALFTEAIQHFENCRNSLQLARTHLLFGEWLRRRRRRLEARQQLQKALDLFEIIGVVKFVERARLELAATGVQASEQAVRTSDQLTERESQIAGLVAAGASNAQVATQLFISSNTVDYHLRHIYRKLGVTSRTKMAVAFRDRAAGA